MSCIRENASGLKALTIFGKYLSIFLFGLMRWIYNGILLNDTCSNECVYICCGCGVGEEITREIRFNSVPQPAI